MSYDVELTETAFENLHTIYNYIYSELGSPVAAKNQIKRIKDGIFSLNEMPRRYKVFEKEPYASKGFRIVSIDNYCIIYTVNSEKQKVYIISVLYGRSDIENRLTLN